MSTGLATGPGVAIGRWLSAPSQSQPDFVVRKQDPQQNLYTYTEDIGYQAPDPNFVPNYATAPLAKGMNYLSDFYNMVTGPTQSISPTVEGYHPAMAQELRFDKQMADQYGHREPYLATLYEIKKNASDRAMQKEVEWASQPGILRALDKLGIGWQDRVPLSQQPHYYPRY